MVELMQNYNHPELFSFITFDIAIAVALKQQLQNFEVAYLGDGLSAKEIHEKGLDGMDYHFDYFRKNPAEIATAQSLALTTNTWTVNDPEVFDEMKALSIDRITTDYPQTFSLR